MLGMTIASALTVFLSLLLGYIVFRRNKNSRIRQAFLLLAFTLAAWAFIAMLAYPAREVSTFMILFRISFVFQILHFGAVLQFIVEVTRVTPKRHRRVYLVYIPCIVTIFFFFVGSDYVEGFTIVEGVLQFNHRYDTVAFFGLMLIWFSYYGTAVHLCLRRARCSAIARERTLFHILAASLVIIVAITFIEVMILPLLLAQASQGMVVVFKFLWLLCIGYLIDRYRFLTAPAGPEDMALSAIPGNAVLILDNDDTIRRANHDAAGHRRLPPSNGLSKREIEIVEQIVAGLSNAEIAERLFISDRTVTTHITHIFTKLGVANRIQLCSLVKDNGMIAGRTPPIAEECSSKPATGVPAKSRRSRSESP